GFSGRLSGSTPKRHIKLRHSEFACEIFHKRVSFARLMPHHDDKRGMAQGFGEGYSYVAAGFTFAFAILLFGALGWLVDGWIHTRPPFAIVGGVIGGFGGVLRIYFPVSP